MRCVLGGLVVGLAWADCGGVRVVCRVSVNVTVWRWLWLGLG
jgi:hypothetical protein